MSQNRPHHGKVARPESTRVTLNKIINFVLLVAALYFLLDLRVPWFRALGTGPGSRSYVGTGTGEEGDCVIAARKAAEVFSDEMRSFSKPPIDVDAWDRTYLRIENRIAAAEDECDCARPGLLHRAGRAGRAARARRRLLERRLEATARRRSTPPRRSAASTTRSTWPPSSRAR